MAKFYQGTHLNAKLERLVERSDDFLLLVSPYIKLHRRFRDVLETKMQTPKLAIIILFGKNEGDITASISEDDLNFLKDFPNIRIGYDKDLHAKYYASEDAAIITSLNLHQFSQNNNIEAGVMLMPDEDAYKESLAYFKNILKKCEVLFERKPKFENGVYKSSATVTDKINVKPKTGYCIRTGEPIPFNLKKPMSYDAYLVWEEYENMDYPENYCHKTGKPSKGKTSMRKPVL